MSRALRPACKGGNMRMHRRVLEERSSRWRVLANAALLPWIAGMLLGSGALAADSPAWVPALQQGLATPKAAAALDTWFSPDLGTSTGLEEVLGLPSEKDCPTT